VTVEEALDLQGLYVCLLLDFKDGDAPFFTYGKVVGVVVPAEGSPVLAQILLANDGDAVSPCGGGCECFLENVAVLVASSPEHIKPARVPALRLVHTVQPPALSLVNRS